MFNDGGRIKELRFGNPTCPYCGVTYPMIERHDCAFSQEAKLKAEKERADKAEKELALAKATLRDQFAMAALTAILHRNHDTVTEIKNVTEHAYGVADAMLEARKAR